MQLRPGGLPKSVAKKGSLIDDSVCHSHLLLGSDAVCVLAWTGGELSHARRPSEPGMNYELLLSRLRRGESCDQSTKIGAVLWRRMSWVSVPRSVHCAAGFWSIFLRSTHLHFARRFFRNSMSCGSLSLPRSAKRHSDVLYRLGSCRGGPLLPPTISSEIVFRGGRALLPWTVTRTKLSCKPLALKI